MPRWCLVLLAGCGRLGFGGGLGGDAGDGPRSDAVDAPTDALPDAPPDAPIDAMVDAPGDPMMFTFGEAPGTMFSAVTWDTYLSNDVGESMLNYGADTQARIEMDAGERALIGFTITAIPPTATIVSAVLEVTFTQVPGAPLPIDLHRVIEAWDEGTHSGTSGVANYLTSTGVTQWASPGAAPPNSATASVGQFTPALGRKEITIPASVVQTWIAGVGSNFGLVMISTSVESTRFTTREGMPSTDRPVLRVTFTP